MYLQITMKYWKFKVNLINLWGRFKEVEKTVDENYETSDRI